MTQTSQQRKSKQLLNRITTEIERWVTNESDPLYGLSVMIERDDRGEFNSVHIRCRKKIVTKVKKKGDV